MRLLQRLPSGMHNRLVRLRPRLYRMALAWCGNAHQADDLVQEAIVKALHRLDRLKKPDSFEAWVFSILANCHRDHCRSRKPLEPDGELVDEHRPTAEQLVDAEQTVHRVRLAVSRLAPGQREVLTLVDLEGFSYAEVASILALPVGTVMSRLNRGRQRLKNLLSEARQPDRPRKGYLKRVK